MLNSFTFDGVCSDYFGLTINRKNIYVSPKRSQEVISVPGRDGDLIFDNGNYENVTISYTCSLTDTSTKIDEINEWFSKPGYKVLSDTYDNSCYRKAAVVDGFKVTEDKKIGTFEIQFSCKPYKYLNSGETKIKLSNNSSKTIANEQDFSSLPLFEIVASKEITLHISNSTGSTSRIITFPDSLKRLYIDSEIQAVYDQSMNLYNNSINFVEFPTLLPGDNYISFSLGTGATISSSYVTPRWRKL